MVGLYYDIPYGSYSIYQLPILNRVEVEGEWLLGAYFALEKKFESLVFYMLAKINLSRPN